MSKNPYRPISAKLSQNELDGLKAEAKRRGVYYGDLVADAVRVLLAQSDQTSGKKTSAVSQAK